MLETILTQEADYRAATPASLQAAAARYLVGARAFKIKVVKGVPPRELPVIPVPGAMPAPERG